MQELFLLALILMASMLATYGFKKLNLPSVIGQLLVGIIFGPAILNWIHPTEMIHLFAHLGVVILMFMAGLESDLQLLKKYLKPSIVIALMGIILPIIIFMIIGNFIQLTLIEGLFLGVIFSATSVSISVEVLKEMNQISSREGITMLGAAIIDDIIGVILLSIFSTVVSGNSSSSGDQSNRLWIIFILQIIYFVGVWIVIKWLAPMLLRLAKAINIDLSIPLMALTIVFAMAGMAELVSLSAIAGAFFAGIAVSQANYQSKVEEPIKKLGYLIFIPVFFTSIGLEMKLAGIWDNLLLFIILTIFAILTKLYGSSVGARMLGFSHNNSMVIGSGMVSRGEVALIIAQVGYATKLIPTELYSTIIGVIIVTTVLAPFLLRFYLRKKAS